AGDQFFVFQELILVPDEDGPYEPILVNDALLIAAAGAIYKDDLFIVLLIRPFGNTDAAKIKTMDLDNAHQGGSFVVCADISTEIAGKHPRLLFSGRGKTIQHAVELSDLAHGIDIRVAG